MSDLKTVERALGIRYEGAGATAAGVPIHYQEVCPACRRRNLALLQDGLWNRGAR